MNKELTILIITALATIMASGQNVNREIRRAEDAFSKGDYRSAISSAAKILKVNQINSQALIIRGRSYYYLQLLDSAYSDLVEYTESPDFDNSYNNKFSVKGIQSYSIWYTMGSYFYSKKDYPKSIDSWDRAVKLVPTSGLYSSIGVAKFFTRNYQDAIIDLNKAIGLDITNFTAYYNRGQCFLRLDSLPQALSDYNKSLTFEGFTNNGHSYVGIGASFYKRDQFNLALKYLEKGLSYENTCASDGYLFRGLTKIKLAKEGGCEDLLKAIEYSADNAQELFDKYCTGK